MTPALLVVRRLLEHGVSQRLIKEQVARELFRGPEEQVALGDTLDVDAGGSHEGERSQRGAIADRQVGGNPAPERRSNQVDVAQTELVDELVIEVGEVADVVEPLRSV